MGHSNASMGAEKVSQSGFGHAVERETCSDKKEGNHCKVTRAIVPRSGRGEASSSCTTFCFFDIIERGWCSKCCRASPAGMNPRGGICGITQDPMVYMSEHYNLHKFGCRIHLFSGGAPCNYANLNSVCGREWGRRCNELCTKNQTFPDDPFHHTCHQVLYKTFFSVPRYQAQSIWRGRLARVPPRVELQLQNLRRNAHDHHHRRQHFANAALRTAGGYSVCGIPEIQSYSPIKKHRH